MNRGDVYRLFAPRGSRGAEQAGARYGVVVQNDAMAMLRTVLVAPTSRSAPPRPFRPTIMIGDMSTRVLVDQLSASDPQRLRSYEGQLTSKELHAVDEALRLVFDL